MTILRTTVATRGGFGMGFFRDPDPDPEIPGIFKIPVPVIFFSKIPKSQNPGDRDRKFSGSCQTAILRRYTGPKNRGSLEEWRSLAVGRRILKEC